MHTTDTPPPNPQSPNDGSAPKGPATFVLPTARKLAAISLAHVGLGIAGGFLITPAVGLTLVAAGVVIAGLGFLLALIEPLRARLTGRPPLEESSPDDAMGAALAGLLTFSVAYLWAAAYLRGRQLRDRGGVVLAQLASGARWCTEPLERSLGTAVPSGVAAQWRDNGLTEHASVAAFARLTLDLLALGAPPRLIADAQRDGLDEIRHAELCFSLATSIDGTVSGPAAFPELRRVPTLTTSMPRALVELAIASLIDGALYEGLSARVLAKVAARCAHPPIREVLRTLARDEARHAAHAWEVIEWCLEEGGEPVAAELRASIHAIGMAVPASTREDARRGAWEVYGIAGHALESEAYVATRAATLARVGRLLAAHDAVHAAA